MSHKSTTLRELEIGKTATVVSVGGEGALRQHFLDMGLIPEADVTMVKYAPMGDPVAVSYTHLDVYKRQAFNVNSLDLEVRDIIW